MQSVLCRKPECRFVLLRSLPCKISSMSFQLAGLGPLPAYHPATHNHLRHSIMVHSMSEAYHWCGSEMVTQQVLVASFDKCESGRSCDMVDPKRMHMSGRGEFPNVHTITLVILYHSTDWSHQSLRVNSSPMNQGLDRKGAWSSK
jgi:hypothetical protein